MGAVILRAAVLGRGGVVSLTRLSHAPSFVRADTNSSGRVNITDVIFLLHSQFLAGPRPPCQDAADTDDNGELDVSDAIAVLNYLFLGGPSPMPPFAECGMDLTVDTLTCDAFPSCE